ncbi:MAG: shikimate kinase, partial [Campylobacteraceae bacterium]|nr:shikimate kinase [Campylobacteraceae bacterium]
GTVVYLKSSFDAIFERILHHPNAKHKLAKRPLLKDLKKAQIIFDERIKEYEKCADITINVENKTPKGIAKEILNMF